MLATLTGGELAGALVPISLAVVGLIFHAGQMAERMRDTQRRVDRLERHAGFWDVPREG